MIRAATPGDRPRLLALQAALASPRPALLELAVGDDPAGDGPLALVACTGAGIGDPTAGEPAAGDPVGYALAVPGVPGDSKEEGTTGGDEPGGARRCVYLAEIAVAPGHRREGHGTALIEAAAARFAGYDQLRLAARADDERALAFYRANGFRVVDERPAHYEDRVAPPAQRNERAADPLVDGLVLARDLAGE